MLFNDPVFLFLFLPVTLTVFFLLGRSPSRRLPLAWLIAASVFFYSYWNPWYTLILLGSIAVNCVVGWLIAGEGPDPQRRALVRDGGAQHQLNGLVFQDLVLGSRELRLRKVLDERRRQVRLLRVDCDELTSALEHGARLTLDVIVIDADDGEADTRGRVFHARRGLIRSVVANGTPSADRQHFIRKSGHDRRRTGDILDEVTAIHAGVKVKGKR